jgi:hypothetical protein
MNPVAIRLLAAAVADVFVGYLRISPYALTIAGGPIVV